MDDIDKIGPWRTIRELHRAARRAELTGSEENAGFTVQGCEVILRPFGSLSTICPPSTYFWLGAEGEE